MLRYGSICSGVEAASLAWEPLGWQPQWFAEIEKFPAAILAHHWPEVENLGDITDDHFTEQAGAVDLLVGGTPCQSFSVAGLRGGLDDDRGNLALRFCQIVDQLTPTWVVWENVPGVLSSNGGRDFGSILGALVECGYGFAYRILDAQFFGVAQRRRRVFVVGYLGDWRPPAAVLFERGGLLGHTEESAEKRQEAAGDVGEGAAVCSGHGQWRESGGIAQGVRASGGDLGGGSETLKVAPAVTGGAPYSRTGNERVEADVLVPTVAGAVSAKWAKGTGGPAGDEAYNLVTVNAREDPIHTSGKSLPLGAKDTGHAVAIAENQRGELRTSDTITSLNCGGGKPEQGYPAVLTHQVRKLTPIECERLQGMPDNHTRIPWRNKPAAECPDGPRYKAIGNSMAVPVMRWIGERVETVERILKKGNL